MVKKVTSVEFEVGDRVVNYSESQMGPGVVTGRTYGGGVFVRLDTGGAYGTGHDNVTAWFKPKEEQ